MPRSCRPFKLLLLAPCSAASAQDVKVTPSGSHAGKLRPAPRTAAFAALVKGRPVYPAQSGRTMAFDGGGKCVAGC
jgi:hypothetical protein